VAEVVFDVMAEAKGDEVADRTQRVLYAKEGSWVWDYQDQGPATPAAPTPIPLSDAIDTVPPVPPVTSPVVQTALLPPVFSIRSGSYPLADFELKLNLSDPNPAGRGMIFYSVDYGNWLPYKGTILVPAGAVIGGQVVPLEKDAYTSSPRVEETYRVKRLPLSAPSIQLTASEFDDHLEIIGVLLTDTNASGLAVLAYALTEPGAAPPTRELWVSYAGEFSVNASQFPSGFTIHACARAVNPAAYIDSSPVQSSVGANFTFADAGSGQIVFVIDASGSMDTAVGSTTRFRLVQDALIGAINRLCPSSRFGVVTFAGNILYSGGTWDYLTATAENKTMIVNEINRFKTDSGTNYEEALRVPGYFASRPSRVFFLTDGEPTGGGSFSDEVDALAASKVPVYTIGVDLRDTGRSRLADIAAATGGTATMVSTN
jgi:hypothetical protein